MRYRIKPVFSGKVRQNEWNVGDFRFPKVGPIFPSFIYHSLEEETLRNLKPLLQLSVRRAFRLARFHGTPPPESCYLSQATSICRSYIATALHLRISSWRCQSLQWIFNVTENAAVTVKNLAFYFESCIWAVFELSNPEQGMRGNFLHGISGYQELVYKNYYIN